ncbi:MAG: hypothetical protein IID40_05240, partial [Planctomycetes bacterium]|nr:hypothetical protein [Planctomycetota bacterium]
MTVHEIVVVDADENEIVERTAILAEDRAYYYKIISDDRHLEECAASIREIDSALKFIGSVYDYVCAEANKLHKKFTSQRKTTKAPFEDAKRMRTLACVKYVDARDAAARLERDKVEAVAQAEAEVAQAEQVIALTEDGDTEAAKAVREAPVAVYVPPPVVFAKPVGVVLTKYWKARVINAALVPAP